MRISASCLQHAALHLGATAPDAADPLPPVCGAPAEAGLERVLPGPTALASPPVKTPTLPSAAAEELWSARPARRRDLPGLERQRDELEGRIARRAEVLQGKWQKAGPRHRARILQRVAQHQNLDAATCKALTCEAQRLDRWSGPRACALREKVEARLAQLHQTLQTAAPDSPEAKRAARQLKIAEHQLGRLERIEHAVLEHSEQVIDACQSRVSVLAEAEPILDPEGAGPSLRSLVSLWHSVVTVIFNLLALPPDRDDEDDARREAIERDRRLAERRTEDVRRAEQARTRRQQPPPPRVQPAPEEPEAPRSAPHELRLFRG
jgi:hypothetical protein